MHVFSQLREATVRDALGWLRMVQNSLNTAGRVGEELPCHVCGSGRDTVSHLIVCHKVREPLVEVFCHGQAYPSMLERTFGPEAVQAWGVLHRAHASLRNSPVGDWAALVKAARL